jgi:hypothetical protein
VTGKFIGGAAAAPEADAPAQGVTLSVPTHIAGPSHGLVLRDGPKPTRPPAGGLKRVDRFLNIYAEGWCVTMDM